MRITLAMPALTVFLSAFLLFLVQPLVARSLLPVFGGSAAVRTCAMLFFQAGLLTGYLYAHLLATKINVRMACVVHIVLLACSVWSLSWLLNSAVQFNPTQSPLLQILLHLTAVIGLPYVVLSSTAPLVQALVRNTPKAGANVYRLCVICECLIWRWRWCKH